MFDELRTEKIDKNTRHFADFPEVIFFDDFYDHLEELFGVEITRFEADGTLEMWLEFTFRGHNFFVNNKFGDYQFYVADKTCPDVVLLEIADHFRQILEKDETDEAEIQEFDESEM